VGALIGSLSSIATLLIQSHYQTKREMKKLAIEVALKDFVVRIEDKSGKLPTHPVAVLINYYDRIIDLVNKNQLTPDSMRALMRQQAELGNLIQQVAHEWDSTGEASGGKTA
jgi:hypothetical protein